MTELKEIVKKMIEAGETAESISMVIKKYNSNAETETPKKEVDPVVVDQATESKKNTGSNLEDGFSEPDPRRYIDITKKSNITGSVKSKNRVYEDTYLNDFAGQEGFPSSFEEYVEQKGGKTKNIQTESFEGAGDKDAFVIMQRSASAESPRLRAFIDVTKDKEFDNDSGTYVTGNKHNKLFKQNAEQGKQALDQIYKGSGIVFKIPMIPPSLDSRIPIGAKKQQVVASLDGREITLKFNGDKLDVDENIKALGNLIVDGKNAIDLDAWDANQVVSADNLKAIEGTSLSVKEETVKAQLKYKDDGDLFKPVTEYHTYVSSGGVSNTVEYIVDPYEKELEAAKAKLIAKYSKESISKIEAEAEKQVREQLYSRAIIDAKYAAREEAVSNGDISQEDMYAGALSIKSKEAKQWNLNSKKAFIASESNSSYTSLINTLEDSFLGKGNDKDINTALIEAEKLGITYTKDDTIIKLKTLKKAQVNKGLMDLYKSAYEARDANTVVFNNLIKDQEEIASGMQDINLSMDAASKNYDLVQKYGANIALGTADLVVGATRIAAEVLTLGSSTDQLGVLGGKYSSLADEIRGSFVSDVAFED